MGKKVLSVTIDEGVLTEWKEYTEANCINASQLIEKLIKSRLEKRGKK
jgi:metal-responsive CopG/Arc/MetJ family transcriptional regulator